MITQGKPKITINKNKFFKKEKETVFIPKGSIHRIENIYKEPVQIAEVQMGQILKESHSTQNIKQVDESQHLL